MRYYKFVSWDVPPDIAEKYTKTTETKRFTFA